jgi:hypothetical protein
MVENMRLFNTKLSEVTTADDIDMFPARIFNGEETADVGTILLNVCAPGSVKSGHKSTPLSEVYTAAGAPLKMPLGIDADLPARGYLGTALIYNNRPWVPHSPKDERDSERSFLPSHSTVCICIANSLFVFPMYILYALMST